MIRVPLSIAGVDVSVDIVMCIDVGVLSGGRLCGVDVVEYMEQLGCLQRGEAN